MKRKAQPRESPHLSIVVLPLVCLLGNTQKQCNVISGQEKFNLSSECKNTAPGTYKLHSSPGFFENEFALPHLALLGRTGYLLVTKVIPEQARHF